ncbi:hypothetical protein ACUVZD_000105 [Pseudomonas aeruginosa]
MALIEIIKQERARALSNRAVIGLAAFLIVVSVLLVVATLGVLMKAGYWWLALLVMTPLGTGFGHYCVVTIRYCRPQWFKPEPAVEPE